MGSPLLQDLARFIDVRTAALRLALPEQRAVIDDPSLLKFLWTTRQSGKTTTALLDFVHDGQRNPHARYIYIAKTRSSAEELAWPVLQWLNRELGLNMRMQEHKLRATLPNGASISLVGADRPGWADRLYGRVLRRVYIDEAAFYSIDLYALIEDHLEATLLRQRGQLWLMSIPGHVPSGLFDDIIKCFPQETDRICGVRVQDAPLFGKWKWGHRRPWDWSVHRWNTYSNPFVAEQFAAKIARKKAANPDGYLQDPLFQRNYLGRRVADIGDRVYAFDIERNAYPGEFWEKRPGDHIIIGMDFGWDDNNAFSVGVWRDDMPDFVEIESMRLQRVLLDEVYSYHRMYIDHYSGPGIDVVSVGDPAHKQLFEDYRRRFDVDLIPAEKTAKFDRIALYNAALRSGEIKFIQPHQSPHVEEMVDLPWKRRPDGSLVELPGRRNDCSDAGLMSWSLSHAYRFRQAEIGPPTPKEANARLERRIEQIILESSNDPFGFLR